MMPILGLLSGVAPIVTDYMGRLMDSDARNLPSKDELAGDLCMALMALPSPKAYGREIVEVEDRMALASFLAGVILNAVHAKKGIVDVPAHTGEE
tara:strand:- start:938 stop:1222 length:285 start_codon:yes stop_codon:yes gene_type:complete